MVFLGTALGRFSQCFAFIFRCGPAMVADIFTQPLTIKKLPTALRLHIKCKS